jgi:hypothetical protein
MNSDGEAQELQLFEQATKGGYTEFKRWRILERSFIAIVLPHRPRPFSFLDGQPPHSWSWSPLSANHFLPATLKARGRRRGRGRERFLERLRARTRRVEARQRTNDGGSSILERSFIAIVLPIVLVVVVVLVLVS